MDLPSLLMAGSLDTLTSYFSVAFLAIFLPVSVVVYAVIPQKARQPLWSVACGKHSVVLCMVLQRTVARFCVGLHILRYVPLCAYSVG